MYNIYQVPSEKKIKRMVTHIVFSSRGISCPRCGIRSRVYVSEKRYRCGGCRRPFSCTSHTWLRNMKLSWRTWYALVWCFVKNVPISHTTILCGVSEVSVRRWFLLFRRHLPDDTDLILSGDIQMDEMYTRKHTLVAAKDTNRKKLKLSLLINTTSCQRHHIMRMLHHSVTPGSILNTDGAGIYQGIEKWWPVTHETDIHSKWEFGKTSEIEGVFGNLRTFIRRKYHHIATCSNWLSVIHEFQARYNHPEIFESPHAFLKNTLSTVPTC